MHAVQLDAGVARWVEVPAPALPAGSVRIAVAAAGVNRADLVQRAGAYAPPPGASLILGLECAGTITEVGPGVTRWKVGDTVCALLAGGGYASQVVVDAGHVLPVPSGLSLVDAAAIVEVFATAWLNLMTEGGLAGRTGCRVLVHAGASGVGTAAVQIARAWGHPTWVTVGSDDKVAACVALGAEGGSVRHAGPWLADVQAWAPGGVDLVLDPVGGSYLHDNLQALAVDGRLVLIGLMGGRSAEIDLGRLLMRRLRVVGSTLRSRSDAAKRALVAELEREVWPRFADGTLRPILDSTFPITEVDAAHALVASNKTLGAVVLTVPQD